MTRNLHLFGGCVIALALACVAAPAFAAPQLANMSAGPSGIEWQSNLDGVGLVLTVSGPDGFYMTQEAGPGAGVSFGVFGADGNFRPAGSYAWELTAVVIAPDAPTREAGGEAPAAGMQKAGKLPAGPLVQSGYFRIADGAILQGGEEEARPAQPAGNRLGAKDQVILDDLIVVGSACIGQDCANGESFGFDTLRLKENNLRIKAQDTSTSASFPTNDWQITFNETSNGGQNKFSIDDIDGGRTPFTIEASAPSHSLYVDDGGRIGLGTSTPVVEVHIKDGDTPTLRLEQDGSSGFTAQTWDLAGNETNIFIRDATNGSKLPFRIRPNAPSNSIFVDTDGDIGIGTSSPVGNFDIKKDQPLAHFEDNQSGSGWAMGMDSNEEDFVISKDGTAGSEVRIRVRDSTGAGLPTMDVDGDIEAVDFNMASSRDIKTDFQPLDGAAVLARLTELPLMEWSYKKDPTGARHLGPVAEDFQAAFGLSGDGKTISLIEANGIALAAIQGLHQAVEEKDAEIAALEARLAALEALLKSPVE